MHHFFRSKLYVWPSLIVSSFTITYSYRMVKIQIKALTVDLILSSLTVVTCLDNGQVGKQPVALKEYCAEYWLKELEENMYRCTGRRDITEILLKTALNTIQPINHWFYAAWSPYPNVVHIDIVWEGKARLDCFSRRCPLGRISPMIILHHLFQTNRWTINKNWVHWFFSSDSRTKSSKKRS